VNDCVHEMLFIRHQKPMRKFLYNVILHLLFKFSGLDKQDSQIIFTITLTMIS